MPAYINLKTGEPVSAEQARIAAAQAANKQWAADRAAQMQSCPCAKCRHS